MKNFIQHGDVLDLTMPYARLSGQGVKVGSIFGVCVGDIAIGEIGPVKTLGCFELPKTASQAWTLGEKVYWDDTNKVVTKTATDNLLIGAAIAVVGSGAGETLGKVRLNGAF